MDQNMNIFPAIFNTNSNVHLWEQFARCRQSLRERGFESVGMSAYLKKIHGNLISYEYYLKKNITPTLKRSNEFTTSARKDHAIVFVWDIDDITMLSRKHIEELVYLRPDINSRILHTLIDNILLTANSWYWSELETGEIVNIEDALFGETDFLRRVAPKYNALKDLYNEVSTGDKGKKSIISHELLEKCGMLGEEVDLCQTASQLQQIYNQRWKLVKKSFDLVNRRSAKSTNKKYANIVMSKEGVGFAAAHLLASGHSSSIPIENIYSTYGVSKKSVWNRIEQRFGEQCSFITISSDVGFPISFHKDNMTYWFVNSHESIKLLYKGQREYLLNNNSDGH